MAAMRRSLKDVREVSEWQHQYSRLAWWHGKGSDVYRDPPPASGCLYATIVWYSCGYSSKRGACIRFQYYTHILEPRLLSARARSLGLRPSQMAMEAVLSSDDLLGKILTCLDAPTAARALRVCQSWAAYADTTWAVHVSNLCAACAFSWR